MSNPRNSSNFDLQFCLENENFIEGISYFESKIEEEPTEIFHYVYLGLFYALSERLEEAQAIWMSIFLELTPGQAESWTAFLFSLLDKTLISALDARDVDKIRKAINSYLLIDDSSLVTNSKISLEQKKWFLEQLKQTGLFYAQNRQFVDAEMYFKEVIKFHQLFEITEGQSIAWYNLAVLYVESRQIDLGITAIQQAISLDNSNPFFYNILGLVHDHSKQYSLAISAFEKAIELGLPPNEDIFISLGYCYSKSNQLDKAISVLEEALTIYPTDLRLKRLNQGILPGVYSSQEEVLFFRNRFSSLLDELLALSQDPAVAAQIQSLQCLNLSTNLNLGYQGMNDLVLQKKYGQFVTNIVKAHYPQFSQPLSLNFNSLRKIKVGYISQRLQGLLGTLTAGWVRLHDRQQFAIYSYDLSEDPGAPYHNEFSEYSDFYYRLPLDIESICEQVIKDNLDILVFTDIGMDPIVTILAAMRLAPIQCTTWSHPITSGLETIDYFLSSELMEPENGHEHYMERLIRLPNLGVAVSRPELPALTFQREDFGLKEDKIIYFSCQSLLKYLPQFDSIYPRIALHISESQFIFIKFNDNELAMESFENRMRKAFDYYGLNYQDFCVFLPRQTHGRFLGLLQVSDIGLDTFSWSGGVTTLHALTCKLPIVTCPGEFMRGRHTYGILRALGITETIAENEVEYVDIAVRLGQDRSWRNELRSQIEKNLHRVFDDRSCVVELESFYKASLRE